MTPEERHERHHAALVAAQARIDHIEASAYANAKRLNVHAPRKTAQRASRSHRVSQVAAWRSHLIGLHGVPSRRIGPFVSLAELQRWHDLLHAEEGRT